MWNDLRIGLFGLNLMLFVIQECSSSTVFNLYTPYNYSPNLPAYFYAITPTRSRIQLPYYQVQVSLPLTITYSPNTDTATAKSPTSTSTSDVEQIVARHMATNLGSYIAYEQRPTRIGDLDDPMIDPSCKLSSWPDNVCDDDGSYPLEIIQDILEENYVTSPELRIETTVSSINTRGVEGGGDDLGSCDAESRIIYPRVARSSKNKWVYVANYDDYLQPVRVKKCSSSRSCSPRAQSTYRSKCQQNTRRLTMVAIDVKRRKPYKETFEMPVECQCTVISSVFPTRSNQPGSQPPAPMNRTTDGLINVGVNQVGEGEHFEERTRRRH